MKLKQIQLHSCKYKTISFLCHPTECTLTSCFLTTTPTWHVRGLTSLKVTLNGPVIICKRGSLHLQLPCLIPVCTCTRNTSIISPSSASPSIPSTRRPSRPPKRCARLMSGNRKRRRTASPCRGSSSTSRTCDLHFTPTSFNKIPKLSFRPYKTHTVLLSSRQHEPG